MAGILCNNGINIGRTRLNDFLRWKDVFVKCKPIPYQEYINKGYFEVKEALKNGGCGFTVKTYVTGKGQQFIYNLVVRDYDNFLKFKEAV